MQEFEGFDRRDYPAVMKDVTMGQQGGDATLIIGSEHTALYDCGMAYSYEETLSNIKEALGPRALDYILISHTHYDHVGSLPYILDEYPKAKVVGSEYAKYVFSRSGALKVIRDLGVAAEMLYGKKDPNRIKSEGARVDIVAKDGDILSLGDHQIHCLNTPGHTDCSMTFILEPEGIMFASESTGVCTGPYTFNTAILKSYEQAMQSVEKCQNYGPEQIFSPHYGMTPAWFKDRYFENFTCAANEEKDYVTTLWNEGLSPEEMLERATVDLYPAERENNQPYDAFVANAKAIFKVYEKYADEDKKYDKD